MATTNHSLPSEEEFARIEGELFTRIGRRHRRQVLRHRLAAVAVVIVAAGAGVAAGTVANPTQESQYAYCYSSDSTTSHDQTAILSVRSVRDSALRPSAAKVARAVSLCDGLWTAGVFSPSPLVTAPKLQACLRDDLTIAVFPRNGSGSSAADFCNSLGLSAP